MKKNIKHILLIAFIIRFVLLFINNFIFVLPQGDGDAIIIEFYAFKFSNITNLDYGLVFSQGHFFLAYLGSLLYSVIGREPFIFGLLMVVLGTIVVDKVYTASFLLWNNKDVAIKVTWFTALFPQLCLHSALILRETPVNLFLILAIISFIKYWKYSQNKELIWFVFYIVIAALFHSGVLFAFLGILILSLTSSKQNKFRNRFLLPLVIIISVIFINYWGLGLQKFGGSIENITDQFQARESMQTMGNSAYPSWMLISGGLSEFWKLPIRYIAFLFSPLVPFMVKNPKHIIGLFDGVLYLLLFYNIYKNRRLIKSNSAARGILIMSLFLILVFSLGVSNVGTAIRHRAKIVPMLLILYLPKRSYLNGNKTYLG
ncbi:hypothetical protein [Lutibacter sp.]